MLDPGCLAVLRSHPELDEGVALVTVGPGAATMSVMNQCIPDLGAHKGAWISFGELDGRAVAILGAGRRHAMLCQPRSCAF